MDLCDLPDPHGNHGRPVRHTSGQCRRHYRVVAGNVPDRTGRWLRHDDRLAAGHGRRRINLVPGRQPGDPRMDAGQGPRHRHVDLQHRFLFRAGARLADNRLFDCHARLAGDLLRLWRNRLHLAGVLVGALSPARAGKLAGPRRTRDDLARTQCRGGHA